MDSRRNPGKATLRHHDAVLGFFGERDSRSRWPCTPLTEVVAEHSRRPEYDHTGDFAYGLDLILEGLEARRK